MPGLCALCLFLEPAWHAIAQTTGSNVMVVPLRISTPETVTADPDTATVLPIEIAPTEALPPKAFVRLKGLPLSASLTEGYAVAPGSWAVSLKALPDLKANLPPMPAGRTTVVVQLVSVDGAVLTETQMTLVFRAVEQATSVPKIGPPPARLAPAEPPKQLLPPPPELSKEDRQRAEKMVAQGDRFLDSGNVAVARQFYQRAADAGLAIGAMKLAATFDAVELDRMGVQGVLPSPADAKRWYERARALGAREADERLARLGGS